MNKVDKLMKNDRILVVCAHPDDEVLLCGGTLLRYSNVPKALLTFTRGRDKEQSSHIHDAATHLGFTVFSHLNYADQQLDIVPQSDLNREVEKVIDKLKPTIVITTGDWDLNTDHVCVCNSVKVATRMRPGHSVKSVLFGETPSTVWSHSSTFSPNLFISLTAANVSSKVLAYTTFYSKEVKPAGDVRSSQFIELLAAFRGNTAGVEYAEAYQVYRSIL